MQGKYVSKYEWGFGGSAVWVSDAIKEGLYLVLWMMIYIFSLEKYLHVLQYDKSERPNYRDVNKLPFLWPA